MALAIELAAARVETFGLRELAAQLDDRFRLLMAGSPDLAAEAPGPGRQRSIGATSSWPKPSKPCCASCRCSPVASRSRTRRPSRPGTATAIRMW